MKWPLRLSVMDKLLLFEDRPAYPCSMFFRLRFRGRLQEAAARQATRAAVERHPFFAAVVRRSLWHGWRWHPAPHLEFGFEVVPRAADGAFPSARYLDLQTELGLCVKFAVGEQDTDVTFQIHHSICDGLGAMSFFADWLVAYAREIAPAESLVFPTLEPERLSHRAELGLTVGRVLKQFRKQIVGLRGVWEFVRGRPTPLVPHRPRTEQQPAPAGFPNVVSRHFTAEETERFQKGAKRRSATMNDMLIRDFLLAVDEWQQSLKAVTDNRFLRVMIPMNVRRSGDQRTPAANIVSSIFLDRANRDLRDPDELLRGINAQMNLIKENELSLTFLLSLMLNDRLPGGIAKTVRAEKCSVSTVFSNLGPLFQRVPLPRENGKLKLGDAVLETLDIVAPLRPYMCAGFALATYADVLSLTMHYDSDAMTATQANDLLDRFARRFVASGN